MAMSFNDFNGADKAEINELLKKYCGSAKWREEIIKHFPYSDRQQFINRLNQSWFEQCNEEDWKEAFLHHPQIGNIKTLEEKYNLSKDIAGREQEVVGLASRETLESLAELNKAYKEKFGFIFIVFASGKTASAMLSLLQSRMKNTVEEELRIAMGEQQKISIKRLQDEVADLQIDVSQLTTHILDTSSGKPAAGVLIKLNHLQGSKENLIAQGITNVDGRIPDVLSPGRKLAFGIYRMQFLTGDYFSLSGTKTFFPYADISFNITDHSHYHIPLLISPFGFTTYRGS